MSSSRLEHVVERLLFNSRWLMVPLYLGLVIVLAIFSVKFILEAAQYAPRLFEMNDVELVLATLALVDLVLIGNLLIMVIISGYENFVSRINLRETDDKLAWVGKIDAGTLKIKLAVAIVAISSIHLLKGFMKAGELSGNKLMWMTIIHLTFVVSALLLAWIDKIAFSAHRAH
jgi:uncharacterized protein (TIGR00645 family)